MPSVAYAAAPLVVWTVYWLAFFPGLVSMDSVNQWGQIVTGKYDDWHPVAHTWLVWLLTRPGHSLGTVSFLQVVLTALLVGLLGVAVLGWNIHREFISIACNHLLS